MKNFKYYNEKTIILDIKKKHKKNITDEDINDYRRKHKKYPDSTSDNDILMLMLLDDVESKSTNTRNTEKVESSTYTDSYTPRSSSSSRNDDDYSSSSHSNYSSSYYSGSSSSSDSYSSSSCD